MTRRRVAQSRPNLAAHGWRVHEAGTSAEALRQWETSRPDLVLLDSACPDADGSSVVRRVRRESTTPILILSARDQERDKVEALEQGADDYVTKPFGLAELRARDVRVAPPSWRPGRRRARSPDAGSDQPRRDASHGHRRRLNRSI